MTTENKLYCEAQFLKYAGLPLTDENYPHGIKLQLRSEKGKTNWFNITPEKARQIENILYSD